MRPFALTFTPSTALPFSPYPPLSPVVHCRRRVLPAPITPARIRCVETPPPPPTPTEPAKNETVEQEHVSDGSVRRASDIHALPARGSLEEDIAWTGMWISVAATTAGVVYWQAGLDRMVEFVTAYVVEYSLSVDNLFVFLVIFRYFEVERGLQLRVLEWGIWGAVVMRGVMVVLGEALVHKFRWVTVLFGGLLIWTGGKLLVEEEGGEDGGGVGESGVVKWVRGLVPVSGGYVGDRFWTREGGRRVATPLLVVLLCIELSDVVFALDSVPAVLGVSGDVGVVYVSNLLAVVGLRNLFFVLSEAIGELRFLRFALSGVLGFVGVKMVGGVVAGWEVNVVWSLAVVLGVLGVGVGASLWLPEGGDEGEAD